MSINIPTKVIWHHSATDDGKITNNYKGICNYHQSLGWKPPCGYHLVIEYLENKLVCHEGRPFTQEGAHCLGQNTTSLGVCVIGNFDKDVPNQEIYEFCAKIYMEKIFPKYGRLKNERHNKYQNKTCPGKNFDVEKIDFLIDRFDTVQKKVEIPEWKKNEVYKAVKNGFIDNTNWLSKIDEPCPTWAVLEMINDAYENMEEKIKDICELLTT